MRKARTSPKTQMTTDAREFLETATRGRVYANAFTAHPEAEAFIKELLRLCADEGMTLPSYDTISAHISRTYGLLVSRSAVRNWTVRWRSEREKKQG